MDFDASRPIYLQLYEVFRRHIAAGEWPGGEKIESVRNLAKTYRVNPNTVQRALAELEREDLIVTDRTRGKYVTEDENLIALLGRDAFVEACRELRRIADDLSMSKEVALKLLSEQWERGGDDGSRTH